MTAGRCVVGGAINLNASVYLNASPIGFERGLVLVQDVQLELMGPPVGIRLGTGRGFPSGISRERALDFGGYGFLPGLYAVNPARSQGRHEGRATQENRGRCSELTALDDTS